MRWVLDGNMRLVYIDQFKLDYYHISNSNYGESVRQPGHPYGLGPLVHRKYPSLYPEYQLTTQAINFFKAIEGPIAVVSVAGLYRTGKSYLLNRVLLNRSNGFGVGPTINPCTKGLWCWGSPIRGTSNDG